jgi:hypothetical protein
VAVAVAKDWRVGLEILHPHRLAKETAVELALPVIQGVWQVAVEAGVQASQGQMELMEGLAPESVGPAAMEFKVASLELLLIMQVVVVVLGIQVRLPLTMELEVWVAAVPVMQLLDKPILGEVVAHRVAPLVQMVEPVL